MRQISVCVRVKRDIVSTSMVMLDTSTLVLRDE